MENMEMYSDGENARIEIQGNQSAAAHELNDNNINIVVVKEWEDSLRGLEYYHRSRKRIIEKVPPLLLRTEKGRKNQECYEPAVVSLGPYHHKRPHLAQADKYKFITLQEYCLSCSKSVNSLYDKVFEVVNDARASYIDGSTDDYNDEVFNRMMLHDGCFILFFIECIAQVDRKMLLNNEYLGVLGFANVVRDILLLENQIPFVVLEVLLELRFPKDKGEDIMNKFFNYLNHGEVRTRDEKVLQGKKPLHLLELYRSYFISLPVSVGLVPTHYHMWKLWLKYNDADGNYNYVKRNRPFTSVMKLKAKGIFLKQNLNEDINFHSRGCYGELKVVRRAVSSNTKVIYLNMIAYELCPHNPNDLRISTYVRVMKSLVIEGDDVKELRNNNILLHSFGQDEEVVKMYDEIEVPAVNLYMFNMIRQGIDEHCNSSYVALISELVTELRNSYFSSPWKTVALLLASAIMVSGFVQTYFTIWPRS